MMTMRWLLLSIVLFGWDFAPHKLVRVKLNSSISVALPQELNVVPSEVASGYYRFVRKPLGIFANGDHTVDFSVNTSATYWPDTDLKMAQQFFKSSIYNLYDKVDWISQGVREVHGKHYIYFEFNSRISRGAYAQSMLRYVYIQYLIEPDRTLTFSFRCIQSLERNWVDTAHAIMNHIRVK